MDYSFHVTLRAVARQEWLLYEMTLSQVRTKILYPAAVLFCLCPSLSSAANWFQDDFKNDKKSVLYGFLGGLFAHELGHISMATINGIEFELDGLSIVYPEPGLTDSDRLRVASAGFQLQWLSSEIAFYYLRNPKNNDSTTNMAAGVVVSHLAITAAYLTFLKNHDNGDIEGMSKATGVSNDQIALAVAIPAILDSWRLFGNAPKWVPKVSAMTKGLGIAWAWTY